MLNDFLCAPLRVPGLAPLFTTAWELGTIITNVIPFLLPSPFLSRWVANGRVASSVQYIIAIVKFVRRTIFIWYLKIHHYSRGKSARTLLWMLICTSLPREESMCVERSDKQTGNARCRASVGLKRTISYWVELSKELTLARASSKLSSKQSGLAISYRVELSKSLTLTWRTQNWV